jgi:hypothetical protein
MNVSTDLRSLWVVDFMLKEDSADTKETIEAILLQLGIRAYQVYFVKNEGGIFARVILYTQEDETTIRNTSVQEGSILHTFCRHVYLHSPYSKAEALRDLQKKRETALHKRISKQGKKDNTAADAVAARIKRKQPRQATK